MFFTLHVEDIGIGPTTFPNAFGTPSHLIRLTKKAQNNLCSALYLWRISGSNRPPSRMLSGRSSVYSPNKKSTEQFMFCALHVEDIGIEPTTS